MKSHTRQARNSSLKNGQQIPKGTRKNQIGTWKVPLETQQSEIVANNIMDHTTKTELAQYIHAALFSLITEIFFKAIKKTFLKTW